MAMEMMIGHASSLASAQGVLSILATVAAPPSLVGTEPRADRQGGFQKVAESGSQSFGAASHDYYYECESNPGFKVDITETDFGVF
eukprot:5336617-Amphidinium_carterae.1